MSIKGMVAGLGLAALACFALSGPVQATAAARIVITTLATIPTTLQTNGLFIRRGGARYRVVRPGNPDKPRDYFRVRVDGVLLEAGDRVAFAFCNIGFGTSSLADGLTLDEHLKAKGSLGSFPNVFSKCKAVYNKRRRRLTLIAQKGIAPAMGNTFQTPPVAAMIPFSSVNMVGTTIQTPTEDVAVTIFVDKRPADGYIEYIAKVPLQFFVRTKVNSKGILTETGKTIANEP